MENLLYRSDGFTETSNGEFAVFMLRVSGLNEEGENVFRFKPSPVSNTIQVTWNGDVGLFPKDVARSLINKGHGRNLTREEYEEIIAAPNDESEGEEIPVKGRRGRPAKNK